LFNPVNNFIPTHWLDLLIHDQFLCGVGYYHRRFRAQVCKQVLAAGWRIQPMPKVKVRISF
jgi:hypothetical protein